MNVFRGFNLPGLGVIVGIHAAKVTRPNGLTYRKSLCIVPLLMWLILFAGPVGVMGSFYHTGYNDPAKTLPEPRLFCLSHINRPVQFVVKWTFADLPLACISYDLMKNLISPTIAALFLFLCSCHRPVAYFQPTSHPAAARVTAKTAPVSEVSTAPNPYALEHPPMAETSTPISQAVARQSQELIQETSNQLHHRTARMQSLLEASTQKGSPQQPQPKPKKKLKLGNQIRQGLGMKIRPELNWWQRISWKLKASVLIVLVAVLFAILHITILAIIFGIVGAFLLITGLKRSFKVKRPWF